jgi:gamma-glutamyltranspeptidase/glutathione hydrolase
VSPTLAAASDGLTPELRAAVFSQHEPLTFGQRVRLPGLARVLTDVALSGRAGFYAGDVGEDLLALGAGEFAEDDLTADQAEWVRPLALDAFGHRLWTAPPNSQGYLALSGCWIAEQAGLPDDLADERWAFVLVEAARQAALDRLEVLYEHADGAALVAPERLGPRAAAIGRQASPHLADAHRDGGTTCVCAIDGDRTGVSLIMSNAGDFGSHLALARHGIFLHSRGLGFSLSPGHRAEYGPGRRPPHTLVPLVVTRADGVLERVLGTMGADGQPQILLQLLARTLALGQETGDAIRAPRWVLAREGAGMFEVWGHDGPLVVLLERGAPPAWSAGLRRRGYRIAERDFGEHMFGDAQMIRVTEAGLLAGASDPRSGAGGIVAC